MPKWFGVSVLVLGISGVAFVGSASAATVGDWEMNEAPGAHTMIDSGPNHLDGTIGSALCEPGPPRSARWATDGRF